MKSLALALFACALLAAPPALAQAPAPQVAVTTHKGVFNGQKLSYRAIVGETVVSGPDGQPAARMVTIAYVRDGVKDPATRPVMFVFNGGPGASSSPLHTGAFGPRRIVDDAAGRKWVDNPYSLVDAVDLVFVDPIGTGVSRPLAGVDGQPFWSVTGDAASVKYVIQQWLKANGREASPRFLCGESYGTTRAGQIVKTGKDLNLDGVLLFSLTGGPPGPDLSFVMTFPTFAAAAAYHGKVDPRGRTPAQIFDEAAVFARTELISALLQGEMIPPAEKTRVAQRMSEIIGLPADFIADKNLRIQRYDFMLNLLKAEGLRTGQLDSRKKGDLATYQARRPPYDDPSMSLATPGAGPSTSDLLDSYLKELKFTTVEKYVSLNLDINSKWKYDGGDRNAGPSDPASLIGAAMRENPKMRLFWAGGLYDITTPMSSARYSLSHGGVPADRLTMKPFATGHSIFETESALADFDNAVRAFVTAK